jgi:SAM-dependent methyltransferase
MASERTPANDAGVTVAPNYEYWRRHGGQWADEYDARKRLMPLYHVQELMLLEYFTCHAPATVLEFGCGVGRHLRYLREVPGLEIFGFDQSAAMVEQCARWAEPAWQAEHVRVGEPAGVLPYADASFDVVYTAEALVHVRPDDLPGVLRELRRVCRGHLFHLETAVDQTIRLDAHEGSWKHDLVEAYRGVGLECVRLEQGYGVHAPYQVAVGEPKPRPVWSAVQLAQLRRLERDLSGGIAGLQQRLAETAARTAELERALSEAQARATRAAAAAERERARVAALLGERERFFTQASGIVRR